MDKRTTLGVRTPDVASRLEAPSSPTLITGSRSSLTSASSHALAQQITMSKAAFKNNSDLFPQFRTNFSTREVGRFGPAAEKFAIWLANNRAYYKEARPIIVELLETAEQTIRSLTRDSSGQLFHLSRCPENLKPWVDPYVRMIRTVHSYLVNFREPDLQARMKVLIQNALLDSDTSSSARSTAPPVTPPLTSPPVSFPIPMKTLMYAGSPNLRIETSSSVSASGSLVGSLPSPPIRTPSASSSHSVPEVSISASTKAMSPHVLVSSSAVHPHQIIPAVINHSTETGTSKPPSPIVLTSTPPIFNQDPASLSPIIPIASPSTPLAQAVFAARKSSVPTHTMSKTEQNTPVASTSSVTTTSPAVTTAPTSKPLRPLPLPRFKPGHPMVSLSSAVASAQSSPPMAALMPPPLTKAATSQRSPSSSRSPVEGPSRSKPKKKTSILGMAFLTKDLQWYQERKQQQPQQSPPPDKTSGVTPIPASETTTSPASAPKTDDASASKPQDESQTAVLDEAHLAHSSGASMQDAAECEPVHPESPSIGDQSPSPAKSIENGFERGAEERMREVSKTTENTPEKSPLRKAKKRKGPPGLKILPPHAPGNDEELSPTLSRFVKSSPASSPEKNKKHKKNGPPGLKIPTIKIPARPLKSLSGGAASPSAIPKETSRSSTIEPPVTILSPTADTPPDTALIDQDVEMQDVSTDQTSMEADEGKLTMKPSKEKQVSASDKASEAPQVSPSMEPELPSPSPLPTTASLSTEDKDITMELAVKVADIPDLESQASIGNEVTIPSQQHEDSSLLPMSTSHTSPIVEATGEQATTSSSRSKFDWTSIPTPSWCKVMSSDTQAEDSASSSTHLPQISVIKCSRPTQDAPVIEQVPSVQEWTLSTSKDVSSDLLHMAPLDLPVVRNLQNVSDKKKEDAVPGNNTTTVLDSEISGSVHNNGDQITTLFAISNTSVPSEHHEKMLSSHPSPSVVQALEQPSSFKRPHSLSISGQSDLLSSKKHRVDLSPETTAFDFAGPSAESQNSFTPLLSPASATALMDLDEDQAEVVAALTSPLSESREEGEVVTPLVHIAQIPGSREPGEVSPIASMKQGHMSGLLYDTSTSPSTSLLLSSQEQDTHQAVSNSSLFNTQDDQSMRSSMDSLPGLPISASVLERVGSIFNAQMKILGFLRERSDVGKSSLKFSIRSSQIQQMSQWGNRYNQDIDVALCLCLSLACYHVAQISASSESAAESMLNGGPTCWQGHSRLQVRINGEDWMQLCPPLHVTKDNLVDITRRVNEGENIVEFFHGGDISDYIIVLCLHAPTALQLQELEDRRAKDMQWKVFIKELSSFQFPTIVWPDHFSTALDESS